MGSEAIIIIVVVFLFIIALIGFRFCIVPVNQAFIVERLGAYHKTLETGLYWLIPLVDRVVRKLDLTSQEIIIMHEGQEVIVTYKVIDPKRYHYGMLHGNQTVSHYIEKNIDESTIQDQYVMNQTLKEFGVSIEDMKIK